MSINMVSGGAPFKGLFEEYVPPDGIVEAVSYMLDNGYWVVNTLETVSILPDGKLVIVGMDTSFPPTYHAFLIGDGGFEKESALSVQPSSLLSYMTCNGVLLGNLVSPSSSTYVEVMPDLSIRSASHPLGSASDDLLVCSGGEAYGVLSGRTVELGGHAYWASTTYTDSSPTTTIARDNDNVYSANELLTMLLSAGDEALFVLTGAGGSSFLVPGETAVPSPYMNGTVSIDGGVMHASYTTFTYSYMVRLRLGDLSISTSVSAHDVKTDQGTFTYLVPRHYLVYRGIPLPPPATPIYKQYDSTYTYTLRARYRVDLDEGYIYVFDGTTVWRGKL